VINGAREILGMKPNESIKNWFNDNSKNSKEENRKNKK